MYIVNAALFGGVDAQRAHVDGGVEIVDGAGLDQRIEGGFSHAASDFDLVEPLDDVVELLGR